MIHRRVRIVFQSALVLGVAVEIYEAQWMNAALVLFILMVTFIPNLLARELDLFIPPELEVMAIAFVFASVFLGELRDYYGRFWWWDLLLHGTSGGLLGTLGFLLVYVLNATPRVELQMRPGFVALFAFSFAIAIGTAWELFEFGVDQIFGTTMQKPTDGDPRGLVDTMEDLVVNAVGASIVVALGYRSAKRGMESPVSRLIHRFFIANPKRFPQGWWRRKRDDDPSELE